MAKIMALVEEQKGIIKEWDDMELIWHHMLYNELRIAPEDHNMILTDIPSNSPENREKMVQRMFEKLNVPGLYISMTSVLAIYDAGRTSGMAVDSGEMITNTIREIAIGFGILFFSSHLSIGNNAYAITNPIINGFNTASNFINTPIHKSLSK